MGNYLPKNNKALSYQMGDSYSHPVKKNQIFQLDHSSHQW